LEVERVQALPEGLARFFGVTDLGLRAMAALARAGDAIIARRHVGLVFLSTTCYSLMPLGRYWLSRHRVPFVLDFQDPWHAAPATTIAYRRQGLKHRMMRQLHAQAEARTAPYASGLIAVSEAYIAALRGAYPSLENVPAETIPFGHSAADLDAAMAQGVPWRPFPDGRKTMLYAGRVGDDMSGPLERLFAALRIATETGSGLLATIGLGFLGTGYQRIGNPPVVSPRAEAANFAARVVERPDRVGLLDALASLLAADALLMLGSGDLSYQPSKLHQLMATRRPILCVAPAASRIASQVKDLATVAFLPSDTAPDSGTVRALSNRLADILALTPDHPVFAERDAIARCTSAESLAARECALFRRALAHAGSRR
jgi:glycosyltransferase involved in cell wall biosynthesis